MSDALADQFLDAQGQPATLAEFVVRDGLWDEQTKVAKVGRNRHTVLFPDNDAPTAISFCNNCGSGTQALEYPDGVIRCVCGYPIAF